MQSLGWVWRVESSLTPPETRLQLFHSSPPLITFKGLQYLFILHQLGSFARLNSLKQERVVQLILWPSPSVHFASLKIRSTPLVIAAGRVVNFDFSFDEWAIRLPHFFHSAPSNDQFSGIHTPFTTCSTREALSKGSHTHQHSAPALKNMRFGRCPYHWEQSSPHILRILFRKHTIGSSHHLTSFVSFSENSLHH